MLVQLVITDPARIREARQLLAEDLAELDAVCSRFRPDSELVRLGDSGGTTTISPLLAEAIAVSLRAAELTDGVVDPTVGAALAAIGYDRDFDAIPADGSPVTAALIPGWREVSLDLETRRLTLPPGVRLDLGATAKGWAADRSSAAIARRLDCGVLVSLGGDTAVAGLPPDGGWRIRVQDVTGRPADTVDGPSQVIAIQGGGLATSSTAARRWRRGGDLLHHILDPRTGMPADMVWRTVSVAAATCADANTASTAAIIKGRAAPGWLASLGLPARLVAPDDTVRTVAGWPALPAATSGLLMGRDVASATL
jgi:thiamine biosynthesis lipoprotein ApbE